MTDKKVEKTAHLEETDQGGEVKTADAQRARVAGSRELKAAHDLNPNQHSGSAGGDGKDSIAIESGGEVIACRQGSDKKALASTESITGAELRVLAQAQTGYPWAKSVLNKLEEAQKLPQGEERDHALHKAQDMADLMARRGPYALQIAENKRDVSKHKETKRSNEADPEYTPEISADKVVAAAEKLFHNKEKYYSPVHGSGKCNVYVNDVMKESGMPRPWASGPIENCAGMMEMLGNDPRYDAPWKTDYSSDEAYQISYKNWAVFNVQPGDIFIWNTNEATHIAIADGKKYLYYAGSRKTHSTAHSSIESYTGSYPDHETNYGPPTAVFRYNHLKY